jgi:hypothetical protein
MADSSAWLCQKKGLFAFCAFPCLLIHQWHGTMHHAATYFSQIENLPLYNAFRAGPSIFNDAPISMLFAIFDSRLRA